MELPIKFNVEMVSAILHDRKTQTRRVMTVEWWAQQRALPYEPWYVDDGGKLFVDCSEAPYSRGAGDYREASTCMRSPYGRAGDRLWVRESFAPDYFCLGGHKYRADWRGAGACEEPKWKPASSMRRAEARIVLAITMVMVQRVRAITEDDAISEGLASSRFASARDRFRVLWNRIYGRRPGCSWDDNPWVWVVGFKREGSA